MPDPSRPTTRTIPTAAALRMLEYHSPAPGFHSHGRTLIPTATCAARTELQRRHQLDVEDAAPLQSILRALAAVYSDHEDWREEWAL